MGCNLLEVSGGPEARLAFMLTYFFYSRNIEPAIWYDTEVKLFEIQRV